MFVRCVGSSSKGNSYALYDNEDKILLIDAGLSRKEIIKSVEYNVSDIVGCIVSHGHT